MIPHNPYLFLLLLTFVTVAPMIAAGAPGVEIPPWVPFALSVVSAAAGVVLKAMPAGQDAQPSGTEVDTLIDRLEALPKDERDELSNRLEWRARLRGEIV
jgi:hypothetical protein